MNARDLDRHDADAPIFDATAFRLDRAEAELIDSARQFGRRVLTPRAAQHDRDATFPIQTFRDMHEEGLLAICVPEADGGFRVSGKKIFASLSGAADYYGVLCTERGEGEDASRRNTLYLAIPADAEGVSVVGDWDPLGMRGTVSRTLLMKDVFVPQDEML